VKSRVPRRATSVRRWCDARRRGGGARRLLRRCEESIQSIQVAASTLQAAAAAAASDAWVRTSPSLSVVLRAARRSQRTSSRHRAPRRNPPDATTRLMALPRLATALFYLGHATLETILNGLYGFIKG
jgi:hypothetical protein